MMIDRILAKFGLIRKKRLDIDLDFCHSIAKRVDEHREIIEAIIEKTDLFENDWHINHFATLDDYLLRLHYLRHGFFPDNIPSMMMYGPVVPRRRPEILGKCYVPEYNGYQYDPET